MPRGKFITVEGGEGVGKSTNIDFLCDLLRQQSLPVLSTREPGGTPLAEKIRDLLLEHGDEPLPDTAELLLFFAARSLHVENLIRPALEGGTWVVCDRFTDATRAYQGAGRGLERGQIETLARWVHPNLRPDLTLLLDAPDLVGRQRAARRGEVDRLEAEQEAFHGRVRRAYLALAGAEPKRFAVIDAAGPLEAVQRQIAAVVTQLFDEK